MKKNLISNFTPRQPFTYLLASISFFLTAFGIGHLLHTLLHPFVGEPFALVFAVFLGGVISGTVQWYIVGMGWPVFFKRAIIDFNYDVDSCMDRLVALVKSVPQIFTLLPHLLVPLGASVVSGVGAASSFSLVISSTDIQAHKQRSAGAQVSSPIRSFADAYSDLGAQLISLSEEASSLALAEKRGDITCTNDLSNRQNCGPKCRLRQRQAAALEQAAEDASILASNARTLAVQFASADSVDTQRELYAEAAELRGNTKQPQIAATLRGLAQELSAPITDPDTGRTVECRDEHFAQSLSEVAETISRRIDLPLSAPRSESAGLDDTALCIMKRFGSLTGLWDACDAPISAAVDSSIMLAGAVELALIILIYTSVSDSHKNGKLTSRQEEFMNSARKLPDEKRAQMSQIVKLLEVYLWYSEPNKVFLAVPQYGPVKCRDEADFLLTSLNPSEGKPTGVNLDMQEADPRWLKRRKILGGARLFRIYKLTKKDRHFIRQMKRDLTMA